ncbi:DUF305 domain-containing protein [Microbispora cellulosiformans]|uniref:DUF305 domain-containing protein n=1 Tax=Microbispora cellulosiformans TaxID=2614688 RepID=A0A5J5K8W2_9ACTN|nr:DUF305 domain-containing protein [Microbispora cellulosiformans]KAA9381420.1 DUF305 domain-containing protein [Microbispora cellulosiformans]
MTLSGRLGPRALAVIGIAVVVVVLAGAALSRRGPADDSPEAGFARDMQTHHAQAVRMAMIVRDRTTDAEVRTLAYDIALTQQQQIGQMFAWLDMWGLPQTSLAPPMAWTRTGHGSMGHTAASMPGMATSNQLKQLAEAQGRAAEALFLRLMITHHKGGVDMARATLRSSGDERVRRLAEAIVAAQQGEISSMERMLSTRDASRTTASSRESPGADADA